MGTNRITIRFVDGGSGDANGITNGVIVDPGGPAREMLPATDEVCFIATAAYGTPLAEEIKVLSRFRDEYLLTTKLGKRFVTFYEHHSPQMAEFISEREWEKLLCG